MPVKNVLIYTAIEIEIYYLNNVNVEDVSKWHLISCKAVFENFWNHKSFQKEFDKFNFWLYTFRH